MDAFTKQMLGVQEYISGLVMSIQLTINIYLNSFTQKLLES